MSDEMNEILRGGGAAPDQPADARVALAGEALRAGIAPDLAAEAYRFVSVDLDPNAQIDAKAEVAAMTVRWPQLFAPERLLEQALRGGGATTTAATTSGERPMRTGSANGGVMRMEPDEPTLNDKLREAFERTRRSGHSNEGGL